MRNEETNRMNMIDAVDTFFSGSSAVPAIAAIPGILTNIQTKRTQINALNQIADGTTTGVTADVNVLRKTMQDLAVKVANAVKGYAVSQGNNTLKALVDYNETKLARMKKEDVDDTCQGIHDAAVANSVGATTYGLGATDAADLQTAIDAYRAATALPRNAIVTQTQARNQAKDLIKDIMDNDLRGQLDPIINTVKTTDRNFWESYWQVREIIDLGSTTAKVRGTVKNVNDVPIANVLFTLTPSVGIGILPTPLPIPSPTPLPTPLPVTVPRVLQGITDMKGKFNVSAIPPGNYDFSWELTGYTTVTESNVRIGAGKELQRKIVLQTV